MLRDAVLRAAARPEIRAAVAHVYAELQREIDARKPICNASGRCCRFDEFGHRLYVTTIELAAFVAELSEAPHHSNPGGCPFQIGGLCSVHAIRPFGCRVFFCDATSDDWQHQQYERFHAELKRLHDECDVPYRYLEWRDALRQLESDLNGLPLAVSRTQSGSESESIQRTASENPERTAAREIPNENPESISIRETASGNQSASGPRHLSLPQLPL